MASTFTTNYGIELITTGEQQGTWGLTTNQAWRRVEQMMGEHMEFNLDDGGAKVPPVGSSYSSNTLTWGLTR